MAIDYSETLAGSALLVMGLASTGCETAARVAGTDGSPASKPQRSEATETITARKKADVTPAIIAASQKILSQHADAPIGSEFPIVVEGRAYVARIEEHDNSSGEPSRPPGRHKGVTVYER